MYYIKMKDMKATLKKYQYNIAIQVIINMDQALIVE